MASSTTSLDHAFYSAVIQRVFRERVSTMVDEARPYSVDELFDSIIGMRGEMRGLLETLPESAFEPTTQEDGTIQWGAGQVIAHMVDAQVNTFLRAARLAVGLGTGAAVPKHPDHATMPALSRADALALLAQGDADIADVRVTLPADADVEATRKDDIFEAAGFKDMLLFLAVHDDSHLEQLRELT